MSRESFGTPFPANRLDLARLGEALEVGQVVAHVSTEFDNGQQALFGEFLDGPFGNGQDSGGLVGCENFHAVIEIPLSARAVVHADLMGPSQ